MEEEKKSPIDFLNVTQEEIDKVDSYKRVEDYDVGDFLKAVVDSELEEDEE